MLNSALGVWAVVSLTLVVGLLHKDIVSKALRSRREVQGDEMSRLGLIAFFDGGRLAVLRVLRGILVGCCGYVGGWHGCGKGAEGAEGFWADVGTMGRMRE